jgi:hypothetical protein
MGIDKALATIISLKSNSEEALVKLLIRKNPNLKSLIFIKVIR